MPDYSRYVYIGTEYPHVSNMPALHVVDAATGKDTLWPYGDQLYGYPIAVRPEGVYGAPGPEIIQLVDPTGLTSTVDTGHLGLFAVITPAAWWASNSATPLLEVVRINPKTDSATAWFRDQGLTVETLGVDASGNPIIAAGTQSQSSAAMIASEIWIVPQPSIGATPHGRLVYQDPAKPITLQGPPIVSAGAIWFETDRGLYVFTDKLRLASSFSGYIAGGCTG